MYVRNDAVPSDYPSRSILKKNFYASVEEAIGQASLVTFDVFDTLLRRPYLDPAHLFDAMEVENGRRGFGQRRRNAERAARMRHATQPDVRLSEIYELVDGVAEDELKAEMCALYPREDVLAWLRIARHLNKPVVAISDMYLPSDFIGSVLAHHRIQVDDLIVSAADGVKKADGSAFRLASRRHGVPFAEMLHVGDNLKSDYTAASLLGMKSVQVCNLLAKGVENQPVAKLLERLKDTPSVSSSITGSIIRDLQLGYGTTSFWKDLGRYHVAPLVYGFAQWVHQHAAAHGVRKVGFVARDGRLPHRAFSRIAGGIDSAYLHLSRAIVLRAALGTLSELVLHNLTAGSAAPVSNYVSRLGSDTQDLLGSVKSYFGGDPVVGTDVTITDLADFFRSEREALAGIADTALPLLIRYLTANCMLDEPDRVAIADVGWSGTAASLLAESIPETRHWTWLYVGTLPNYRRESRKHRAMYFQYGEPRQNHQLIFECLEIFEFLFSSPEPTAIALTEHGGTVKPLFAELSTQWGGWVERTAAIADGVDEALASYLLTSQRCPGFAVDEATFTAVLRNVLLTKDDTFIREFSDIQHQLGLGAAPFLPLIPKLRDEDYWSNILRLVKGKRMKGREGQVFWSAQQERHFVKQQKGIKLLVAQLAFQVRKRASSKFHRQPADR
jgi:FMN phosphatase YigB (HAD superfamily)